MVIGNGDYAKGSLRNPVNDARSLVSALHGLGFEVLKGENLSQGRMKRLIDEFGRKLKHAEVGLFFYAGHGMQIDGYNYLIPIGANLADKPDVEYEAVRAGRVLAKMQSADTKLNIVILDACRDNPFARGFRSQVGKGLAYMDAPSGSIIAYATAPGSTAADGGGANSPFTQALVRHLAQPGVSVDRVLKMTGAEVRRSTGGKQEPWISTNFYGDYYLKGGASQPKPIQLAGGPGATGPTKQERIAKLLEEADALMGAGKLTSPAGNNALEKYNKVLFLQPMNSAAAEGLKNIAAKYVEWARARIKAGDYDKAEAYLQRAEESREGDPRVLAALDELRQSKAAPRPTATARPVQQTGSSGTPRRITNSIGMEFVLIPAGSFDMGSNNGDSDEKPVHRVTISKPFYMQTTEMTQGQWQRVMGDNPSYYSSCGSNCPVEQVSWNDVQEFIRKLNAMEGGNKYRLPTEAQWEYAARAGSATAYYFGNGSNQLGQYAWYGSNSGRKTHPVAGKKPNRWGLYDMHGDVWEWCSDWYGENYYSSSPTKDPQGPSSGDKRVLRGGCCYDIAGRLRSAIRLRVNPDSRINYFGFRLTRITP